MIICYLKIRGQVFLKHKGKALHILNNFLDQKYYVTEGKSQLPKYICGLTFTIFKFNYPRLN